MSAEINPAPPIDVSRLTASTDRAAAGPSRLLLDAAAAHPQWARDRETFLRLLPELLRTHRDQFVAIYQGALVGVGADAGEAADNALRHVGPVEMYVDQVTDKPKLYRIPGPRLARSEAGR